VPKPCIRVRVERGPFLIHMQKPKDNDVTKQSHSRFGNWLIVLLVVCLIAIGIWALFGKKVERAAGQKPGPPKPGVAVVAVAAKKADFPIYLMGLGTVTPVNTVALKTRVDGQLIEVLFREGQIVRAGDLLARIDPRPFEVQLTQAKGQMARDLAFLKNAQLDLQRYRVLWEQDAIQKQQLDTQESLVRQYEGIVKLDQGQIDSARLQLTYCRITAPISGRVGLRLVDPGNIIHATDANGLVVITQLQPITIIFPIPEDSLQQVLAGLRKGKRMPVEAYDREMKQKLAVGYLLTIDNQIDPNTGTVRLRAVFPNGGNELFPNQFVNARLLIDVRLAVTIVPAPAIQRGPQGTFVYVVKPDRTATMRAVTVGEIQGGEASIKAGLSPDELVVVDGAERLREGTRVELKPENGGPSQRGY
jgi:multidrug efflux system membrane fusion protein